MPARRHQPTVFSLVGAGLGLVCILHASSAQADTSSWLSAGAGYGLQHSARTDKSESAVAMSFAVGVGSDPNAALVVGGIFRSTTYFGLGTDLAFGPRFASGGFARGSWGLALDIGAKWRTWAGGDVARFPLTGMLVLGAPWGLELGVGGDVWNIAGEPTARGVTAVIGIDLLRLTLMRRGGTESYWPNPLPAGGMPATAPSRTIGPASGR